MTDANAADEAIFRLLSAARRRPAAVPDEQAAEYDWASPSGLTPQQRRALEAFVAGAAQEMAAALAQRLHLPVELTAGPIAQRYAAQLAGVAADQERYYISLSSGSGCCGYVGVQGSAARQWVAAVLGDATGGGENRSLSALETALLVDVIAAAVEAFSQAMRKAGAAPLQCGRQLAGAPPRLDAGEQDACSVLPLTAMGAEAAEPQTLMVLSMTNDVLLAAMGGGSARSQRTAQQTRGDMQAYVEQVEVGGEVWLAASQLTMRDVMALGEGDVLLLEAGLADPVELTCGGRTVAWGYAAQNQGCYAIRVAGRCDEE